jgi:repressor LexA
VSIGERIKARRKQLGLSVDVLAEKLGKNRATIYRYESDDIENMPLNVLEPLAEVLQVSPSYLMGWDDSMTLANNALKLESCGLHKVKDNIILLPIVGHISCGNGILAYEDIEGYEPTPKEWVAGGEFFYLRARGDSMTGARIQDGDLLLIRKQPDVENGEIAAVLVEDEVMLKRVYRHDKQLVLQSENPNYAPVFAPPAAVRIIGKLKKIVIDV